MLVFYLMMRQSFNEDLNNDNQIGDTIKSVKYNGSENNDDFSIYETSSGAYIFDDTMLDMVDVENPSTVSPKYLLKHQEIIFMNIKIIMNFLVLLKMIGSSIYHQDAKGDGIKIILIKMVIF